MKKNMNMKQIIEAINGTYAFINKDYKLPYPLRRAMRKNLKELNSEYVIFDEERKRILSEIDSTNAYEIEGADNAILQMLDMEVTVEIEMVSEKHLENVDSTYNEEMGIDYMILWEEDVQVQEADTNECSK